MVDSITLGESLRRQGESKWIALMISWVLPLAIFGFVWFFMIRRMSGGPQGVLSLGKAG